MTKAPDTTAFEALRAECENLRRQLVEAHQALASLPGPDTDTPIQASSPPCELDPYIPLIADKLQGIGVLAASGLVLQANRRMARLLGTSPDRLLGSPMSAHLPDALTDCFDDWLDRAQHQPVQESHRLTDRDGTTRHLHFTIDRLPPGADATLSVVVTDLDQVFRREVMHGEADRADLIDRSLEQARTQARQLLESAIAAQTRADAMQERLRREIESRERVESELQETKQRYLRAMSAIGNTQWLSTSDWRTLLYLGGTE